jgi:hypothetical protein
VQLLIENQKKSRNPISVMGIESQPKSISEDRCSIDIKKHQKIMFIWSVASNMKLGQLQKGITK